LRRRISNANPPSLLIVSSNCCLSFKKIKINLNLVVFNPLSPYQVGEDGNDDSMKNYLKISRAQSDKGVKPARFQ
jgi:hypothetical protein